MRLGIPYNHTMYSWEGEGVKKGGMFLFVCRNNFGLELSCQLVYFFGEHAISN